MKKGFIFSFDSFLALVLFTLFTILIYLFFVFSTPVTQQYYFSEDIINVLSTTKISDLNLAEYPDIELMVNDGRITDTSSTIIEQILTFELNDNREDACGLFGNVTENLVPAGYKVGIGLTTSDFCAQGITNSINLISRNRISVGRQQA